MGLSLKVDPSNPENSVLQYAADFIRVGGLVVYPTDTLYGIGANAFSRRAITEVYEIKKRERMKPLLLIVESVQSLRLLVQEVTPLAAKMMDAFWPGPLTLVFRASDLLPEVLTREEKTIAVRVPSSALCMSLLKLSGCPITATSANITGQPTPKTVGEIKNQLGAGVDLFLDAGELPETKPSTLVDVSKTVPKLLREGAIGLDRLKQIVPEIIYEKV